MRLLGCPPSDSCQRRLFHMGLRVDTVAATSYLTLGGSPSLGGQASAARSPLLALEALEASQPLLRKRRPP